MFRVAILALCIIGTYGFYPWPKLPGRIVGGVRANITEIPYQASLRVAGFDYHCGAVIIGSKHVLTAAHCISPGLKYQVSVGSVYTNGTLYNVKRAVRHEKFANLDYDIALLELNTTLKFSNKVKPLKLPTSEPKPGTVLVASGWGATSAGGSYPSHVMKVSVPVVDRQVCRRLYTGVSQITDRMICAGYLNVGGKDSCNGDSGGPLAKDGVLYGLVSFGYSCALPEYPGVYTNVASLRPWIKQQSGL